jgi:hypothetical protein
MSKKANINALKHGAFTSAVLLPDEDPAEFEELLTSVHEEWNPEGSTELEKVNSIAIGMWRKLRVRRYFQKYIATTDMKDKSPQRFADRRYNKLVNVLEKIESEVESALTEENLSEMLDPKVADAIRKA